MAQCYHLTSNKECKSPWVALRQDENLRAEILQDVERCMPDNTYFRRPDVQKMLLDVLFIFCKLNRDVGYRQGMHELLAPILWVVECDAISHSTADVERADQEHVLMETVLDPQCIEKDSFTLFCLVMQPAKSFYEHSDHETKTISSEAPAITSPPTIQHSSPIVERSQRIHEVWLARVDPELSSHLTRIEILPQIFLIRWIRLLFGREFPFDELLGVWDALFAFDPGLELVDFICVAMLLRIRWQLLESDYATALSLLLRYPAPQPPEGPSSFVQDALYLKENRGNDGGSYLILKYSGKTPSPMTGVSRPSTPQPRVATPDRPETSPQRRGQHQRLKSSLSSPAKLLQNAGGVEALLQDTAKAMYQRGEKWGLNKAVRDAVGEVRRNVQGLQSGESSPRRNAATLRWSLDDGRHDTSAASLRRTLNTLEQRNKLLSDMLDSAVEELWSQREKPGQSSSGQEISEAYDMAVAKVQFVKVYLEDPTLSLPVNDPPTASVSTDGTTERTHADAASTPAEQPHVTASSRAMPQSAPLFESSQPLAVLSEEEKDDRKIDGTSSKTQSDSNSPSPVKDKAPVFRHSRSSLAQSSFAWMLGDDEPRSGFVASPHSSTKGGDRPSSSKGVRGTLFKEGPSDDRARRKSHDAAEEEAFSLGTWKGGNPTKSPQAEDV
ncbi:MAG: hypothetical protein M1833_001318 [Piccolia ochrophora]|nr:MAG: hypothetical protein M1833_001318 [Piccolia ochrophora]